CGRSSDGFYRLNDFTGGNIFEMLGAARGPADLDRPRRAIRSESDDQSLVACREIARRGLDTIVLNAAGRRNYFDYCPDGIAIGTRAAGANADPTVAAAALVAQEDGALAEVSHHDVDGTVIIQIAECRATTRPRSSECGASID